MRTALWIVYGLGSTALRSLRLFLTPLSLLMMLAIAILAGLPTTSSLQPGSGIAWKLAQTSMGDTMYVRGRIRMNRDANLEAVSIHADMIPIEIWSR
jgi:hypothetical protein